MQSVPPRRACLRPSLGPRLDAFKLQKRAVPAKPKAMASELHASVELWVPVRLPSLVELLFNRASQRGPVARSMWLICALTLGGAACSKHGREAGAENLRDAGSHPSGGDPTASDAGVDFKGSPPGWKTEALNLRTRDSRFADDWFEPLFQEVAKNQWYSAPRVIRSFALVGVALYEGLLGGMPGYQSLGGQLRELPQLPPADLDALYDWPTVASAAVEQAYEEAWHGDYHLYLLMPPVRARRAEISMQARQLGVSDLTVQRSLEHGQRIGEAVVAWFRADGFYSVRNEPFSSPNYPGAWERTGALRLPPQEPQWGRTRTYVLRDADECSMVDPPPYSEAEGSEFFAEARTTYEASTQATEADLAIVYHWAGEVRRSYTPGGHWMYIARMLAQQHGLSLDRTAELYVRLALVLADAAIVCWKGKYDTFLIRPETYIQRLIDPGFRPRVVTPNHPAYPSGHSTLSGAAGSAILGIVGPLPFEDRSGEPFGRPSRAYASVLEASAEAAASRVIGGIHYPMDEEAGVDQGECVARRHAEGLVTRAP